MHNRQRRIGVSNHAIEQAMDRVPDLLPPETPREIARKMLEAYVREAMSHQIIVDGQGQTISRYRGAQFVTRVSDSGDIVLVTVLKKHMGSSSIKVVKRPNGNRRLPRRLLQDLDQD